MVKLKKETIKEENVIKTMDGYYRYINEKEKLLTTGFLTKESLLKHGEIIRFDYLTLEIMKERFQKYLHKEYPL